MTTLSTPLLPFLAPGGGGGGSGTVTSVSVATANGFAGTVATATTTPAITVKTGVTGLLKGNGTAVSAAVAGTDYLAGPLSPALMPWQFYVPWPGAGVNATPALRTALTSAASYMAANQGYAEIWVDPQVYTLSSALTNSGLGNAQLPLPVIGTGITGGILHIRCTSGNGGANPYFNQTVAQKSGAIFYSTLTGQVVDGTFGAPYILGGPSSSPYVYGGTTFNNLMLILDGITFMPQEEANGPTMGGAFLGSLAKAQVISGAYFPDATLTTMNATTPANFWANGLYMPWPLNNDNCFIGTWAGYGGYRAAIVTSHTAAQRIAALYCLRAVGILCDSDGHGPSISNLSAELCTDAVYNEGSSGPTPLFIGLLDCEQISGNHINDNGNFLSGSVLLNTNGATVAVNGAANMEIISTRTARGFVSPPSVPATTVALANPFWRHATVYLTSGGAAVTAIAVNGTATGLTLGTTGTVMVRVPTGATITLTYASTAPTWTWDLE